MKSITRGGKRPGAGAPSKPLVDKVLEGNPGKRPLKTIAFPNAVDAVIPEAPSFLSAEGVEIFHATIAWLQRTGCLSLILPAHVEEYAKCKARWLECEAKIDSIGLIAKHPTTGQPIQSPFVNMGMTYLKQANAAWNQIYEIVKQNCTEEFRVDMPHADVKEYLLTMKRK